MSKSARSAVPLFAVLALALVAWPRPAAAQALGWHPAPMLVAAQEPRRAAPRHDGRKIACTPSGCHRIPRGCYPEAAYDFWGNPTGYDKIVCPRR